MLFIIGGFIVFPQMERASNIIQLQFMCGIRAILYWLSTYAFDLFIFTILIAILIFIIFIYEQFATNIFGGCSESGN